MSGLEVVTVRSMAVYNSSKEKLHLKANSSVSIYDVDSLRRVSILHYSAAD
jgi:hypothetical protein